MKKRRSTGRPSTNSSQSEKQTKRTNRTSLRSKSLLLGVTGGVAAYKAVELARRLTDEGASVRVIMTEAAQRFITPLSLEVASRNRVLTSLYDEPLSHISLTAEAHAMIVAPATANIIAKFSSGIADDLLSTSYLAFRGPVLLAPAMNWRMFGHPATGRNIAVLRESGVRIVGPESGSLACGEEGPGRMAGIPEILSAVRSLLSEQDLQGLRIVVTAGPTREYLDSVRFISNRSSGKMGYALAQAAGERGARVTLISGPSSLDVPPGVEVLRAETSEEMFAAVRQAMKSRPRVLIMAAAVADFAPEGKAPGKIEKERLLSLPLKSTRDIIAWVARQKQRPFVVGFAAQAGPELERAEQKMSRKNMDMIVFNDVSDPQAGFDVDTNRVVIMDRSGRLATDVLPKSEVAHLILDRIMNNHP